MKGKFAVILSLMVLSLLFTSTAVLAEEETVKIKFYFIESGSCLVTCGDVSDPLWEGVGAGALMLSGKADGEYYEQPADGTIFKGYLMDNLAARGCLLLRWTETDNSKRWVSVTFYSTATSIGVYFNDPVVLGSISMFSANPNDYIRFKGIYYDGSKIQRISGIAGLMIIQFSEEGYGIVMQLRDDTLSNFWEHSMFRAIWSNVDIVMPGYPQIPAAQVFMWNVEITP